MFECFVHIIYNYTMTCALSLMSNTESKKTHEFNIVVYPKTQKKIEKGGGDGMNLIMGCNLVKPK